MHNHLLSGLLCLIVSVAGLVLIQQNQSQKEIIDSTTGIELLGIAEIAGTAHDKSELTESLGHGYSNDLLGGLSAIAYSGTGNRYYVVPDRGPDDGAVEWTCRVDEFEIAIDPDSSPVIKIQLVATHLLTDPQGRPFVGLAAALDANEQRAGRLDPEGICVGPTGNLYISDEYGPRVLEFRPDGRFVRELKVPPRFLVMHPCLRSEDENSVNDTGRQANRGMEGLAISSTGEQLYGLMQSPLLQDCDRTDPKSHPQGQNCRLLELSTTDKAARELVYHLDEAANGLNEILAIGPHDMIVIERDGKSGDEARYKKLILASSFGSSDVSDLDRLAPGDLPDLIQPLRKTVLIDLLDPLWKLAGDQMPEKLEGLTFGPNLPDGRRTLLISSDNDFEPESSSYFYVFAVPENLLTGKRLATTTDSARATSEF